MRPRLPRLSLPRARRDVLGPAAILTVAGAVVVAVWVLTGWWSLSEQTSLAHLRGFAHPPVLFWGTDAFAVAMALVALSAAVDNRPAPLARLGYALALAGSAYFNAEAAAARLGDQLTPDALAMAAGVPLASFAALEVILAAIRATVRRWRGLPAPAGAPSLRFGRLVLGGAPEFRRWRSAYLDATRPDAVPGTVAGELREEVAEQLDQLARDVRTGLAAFRESLPAPAPAVDSVALAATRVQLNERAAELRGELLADLDSRLAAEREYRSAELDRLLAALPRPAPAPAPARPAPAGEGDNDTARMRAHWDAERAAGRTPTGAELDRHVGRDPSAGYGRALRGKWLKEAGAEQLAGVSRLPARASAGE